MNTRTTFRNTLCALTALLALSANTLAPAASAQSKYVSGPVQNKPLPLALPDLTFQYISNGSEGSNTRWVCVINNGNGYAPPTTMRMTWLGDKPGGYKAYVVYHYQIKGLAPGESQVIAVDAGVSCYQFQLNSHVSIEIDDYSMVYESNEKNNLFQSDNNWETGF